MSHRSDDPLQAEEETGYAQMKDGMTTYLWRNRMATETPTVVSIKVDGKTVTLNAEDALIFAWHITQAFEYAVEGQGASVVLAALPGRKMRVHRSSLEKNQSIGK